MNIKNLETTYNWKNWLIKKLLSNKSTKKDVLTFIANEESSLKEYDDIDDNNERSLIKNIVNLNEKSVEDIMVPRGEIIALDINKSYKEILDVIKNESHSRIPVYNKNLDNIVGFFHIKDFIKNTENNFELRSILREIIYVAPKSPILDLLKTMRSSRIHIALVVDGVGGVDGLVTIEDLVEEIVGEIEDEHDADDDKEHLLETKTNSIVVDAAFRIDELERYFETKFISTDDEEIDTVGGLVFAEINRIPKSNEVISISKDFKIKILKSSDRKIDKVEVFKNN